MAIPHPIEPLRHTVLVSVQAETHEPFYPDAPFLAMAQSVLNGGAAGLRLAGSHHIALIKQQFPDIPVMGLTKPSCIPKNAHAQVYITPKTSDLKEIFDAGAEMAALDATARPRPGGETLETLVAFTRKNYPGRLLVADVATLEEGLAAEALGMDVISTTLSGYTTQTLPNPCDEKADQPDFALLKALVEKTQKPVILEGRIWQPQEVAHAFSLGAFAVVIGSAITRPHLITRRFCKAC